MARLTTILICGLGGLALIAGVLTPVVGIVVAAAAPDRAVTGMVAVPSAPTLLGRSLVLSAIATFGAVLLGLCPGMALGSARGRTLPIILGLVLAPLLIPPQIYAYAWELASGPQGLLGGFLPAASSSTALGGAVRAGAITAGWLWPIVALIVGAGWRVTGRSAYALAILDTTPARAYLRAVIPSLRNHLTAAASLVFAISLIEYAIPHLTLSRVYATELVLLVDAGAPAGQIVAMAAQVSMLVLVLVVLATTSVRATADWQPIGTEDDMGFGLGGVARRRPGGGGWTVWSGLAIIWLVSVGVPVAAMCTSLREAGAWCRALTLFAREWTVSLSVSLAAAGLAIALAVVTVLLWRVSNRRALALGAWASCLSALVPPAALGIGFIAIYNRPGALGTLYDHTPWVWCLALVGRYGVIAVLIAWLALGRRSIRAVEQARSDGASNVDVLAFVLLPMLGPSLVAAGLIVTLLSLFEVVASHLVGPVGYPSLGLTLLNHMHYGRDDVVIATCLTVCGAGLLATWACGWLLVRARRQ